MILTIYDNIYCEKKCNILVVAGLVFFVSVRPKIEVLAVKLILSDINFYVMTTDHQTSDYKKGKKL